MWATPFAVLALAACSTAAPAKRDDGDNANSSTGRPVDTEPPWNAMEYTATFDDIAPRIENAALQQTGPYGGLSFEGIDAVSLSIATEIGAGIEPKSYPNAGAYGLTADVTRTPPKITSDYPGSTTNFFDFQSFYFGCVAGAVAPVASAPVECELTVIGYNSSHEVARQTFTYSPGIALRADMMRADLSDEFRGINHATFESKHDVTGVLGATLLDDLNYTAYSFDEDYANDADDNDKPADTHSSSEQDKSENDANKRTVVQQDLSALYTRGISEEEKENGGKCKCKPVRPLSMYKKCSWRPNKYATEAQKNRECKCHYEGWNIECQVVPA